MIHALHRLADLLGAEISHGNSVGGYRTLLESIIRKNKAKNNASNTSGDNSWHCKLNDRWPLMNDLCCDLHYLILQNWNAPTHSKDKFYLAFIAFVSKEFGMSCSDPYRIAPPFRYFTLYQKSSLYLTNRISSFEDIEQYVESPDE